MNTHHPTTAPKKKTLVATLCLVVVVLLLLAAATDVADAAKVWVRDFKSSNASQPTRWKNTIDKVTAIVRGDTSLASGIADLNAKYTRGYDPCLMGFLMCSSDGDVVRMELTDFIGEFAFGALIPTIRELSFVGGHLPSSATNLKNMLPDSLESLSFMETTFYSSSSSSSSKAAASPSTQFTVGGSTTSAMRSLTVYRCKGISTVDWSSLPASLAEISFENMTSFGVGIDKFKPSKALTSFKCQHCGIKLPLAAVSERLEGATSLHELNLIGNDIEGSLPSSAAGAAKLLTFSKVLQRVYLSENGIVGDVADIAKAFTNEAITELDLSWNRLAGTIDKLRDFTQLTTLMLSGNHITGVTWAALPNSLSVLEAHNNAITGTVPVAQLSHSLTVLDLSFNKLTGSIDFTKLHEGLATLDLQSNKLSGTAVFNALPNSMRFVFLQNNEFSGQLDLTTLPLDLRRIVVANNKWDANLPPL